MKAIIQTGYGAPGEVLELADLELPTITAGEVLVRVRAASVHPDVWHVVRGWPYVLRVMGGGFRRPKVRVPGTDLAGVVETVGAGVTRFKPGGEVFGESIKGFQWANGGAYAEYAAVREDGLALKPASVSFEEAAAVPTAGIIALSNLDGVSPLAQGARVLVNGAAGGVGSLVMQIAKARGAEVTGVDRTDKLDMMRTLGADHVIDYTKDDFTRLGERYDVVVDIPGNHRFSAIKRALTPRGQYVLIGHDNFGASSGRLLGSVPRVLGLVAMSPFSRHLPRPNFKSPERRASMAVLAELLEAGHLKPIVDRTFPLAEVPEAIAYMASGQAMGRTVITA